MASDTAAKRKIENMNDSFSRIFTTLTPNVQVLGKNYDKTMLYITIK